jgi:hypothetical protein
LLERYTGGMTTFRIRGLPPQPFAHLFDLSDEDLAKNGAKRYLVDRKPGFPDRIEMRDLEFGEWAILLNYEHQPAPTPYRSCHAVYVGEHAVAQYDRIGEVPEVMRVRQLSLRAFDEHGMMVDADVIDGAEVESLIDRLFSNPRVAYIHVHNAKRGCYSGRIDRVLP